MDGYLLRHSATELTCQPLTETPTADEEAARELYHVPYVFTHPPHECHGLTLAPESARRVHLFIRDFALSPDDVSVTLITQLSLDRWSMFENMVQTWMGPVSAAVWCSDEDIHHVGQIL